MSKFKSAMNALFNVNSSFKSEGLHLTKDTELSPDLTYTKFKAAIYDTMKNWKYDAAISYDEKIEYAIVSSQENVSNLVLIVCTKCPRRLMGRGCTLFGYYKNILSKYGIGHIYIIEKGFGTTEI